MLGERYGRIGRFAIFSYQADALGKVLHDSFCLLAVKCA